MEYCWESENLTTYHIGVHKCALKLNTKIQTSGQRGSTQK